MSQIHIDPYLHRRMRKGRALALIPATDGHACTRWGMSEPRDELAGRSLDAPVASAPLSRHPMPLVMQ